MKLLVEFGDRNVVGKLIGSIEYVSLAQVLDMIAVGTGFVMLKNDQGEHLLVNLALARTITRMEER